MHQQDIAFLPGYRITRLDFGDVVQSGGCIIGLRGIERGDGDERRQHAANGLRVDPGRIPGDYATGLQSPHPGLHRRHRQTRNGSQMGQRRATVGDQLTGQHTIDIVERRRRPGSVRICHRRTVSDERTGAMSKRVETWQLRAQFAAGLSQMYGAEVPAYHTLVEVTAEVNRAFVGAHSEAQRLGTLERVTAERHGAIRVGNTAELAQVADLFSAFGMYPVGYYDLREAASPVPVVSTAFRPVERDTLERNPFRVFTSMLATADRRFFSADLGDRVQRFLAQRRLFDPALITRAQQIATAGGCSPEVADEFVAAAVSAFALSSEPIDRTWYQELAAVSAVAADIAGVTTTHINHLTPRVLDIDELHRAMTARGITMIDDIQGPPRTNGPQVLLRQTSFRALAEPRRFRATDGSVTKGTLRVRFGEVEQRGVALTPLGRQRFDAAMSEPDPAAVWEQHFPATDEQMAAAGLAYYCGRDPAKPVVYEDFLPASAAGIFRSNLESDTAASDRRADGSDDSDYSQQWMAGQIGHHIHDPYELYEKVACS